MDAGQEILTERINLLCKREGISYYKLSAKSGVPLSTLMHIMDGTVKNPGVFTVVKLCDAFGVTPAEFFDTKDFENMKDFLYL